MQENNFKAVLESIRDLMNEETIIPEWLTNIFLGYGDPAGAQYTSIVEEQPQAFIPVVDFKDTFLDGDHLAKSFPGAPFPFLPLISFLGFCIHIDSDLSLKNRIQAGRGSTDMLGCGWSC